MGEQPGSGEELEPGQERELSNVTACPQPATPKGQAQNGG